MDLFNHLLRQLNFIERSCEAYDRGHSDEAIRIAQQVRVVIHQTPQSTSLLKQLGATHIRLRTTVEPASQTAVYYDGISHITFRGDSSGRPVLQDIGAVLTASPAQKLFPVDAWWNQLLYVRNDVRVTRRNLVLTAANKDGGAHVDPNLTREYQELSSGLWSIVTETTDRKIPDSHFYFLRQIGYEIINSPDLQVMANTRTVPLFVPTPPSDLEREPFRPLQKDARDLGMPDHEFSQFMGACRQIVTVPHYELLWSLYMSSPGGSTNPQGSFDKAVAAGFSRSLSDWLSPLLAMGLLETQLQRLPRGGQQIMYSATDRGRAFVTEVVKSSG